MKTIRIRKFTIFSLILLLSLPWLFFVGTHFIQTKTLRFDRTASQKQDVKEVIQWIEADTASWSKIDWQHQVQQHLQKMNMEVVIRSASNKVIFQTDAVRNHAFTATDRFSVIEDGNVLGRITIYQENPVVVPMIATSVGFILALFIISLLMRRMILKPLESMSQSARQVAEGDFDIVLPSSAITEIADVSAGFKVMVTSLKAAFEKQIELENDRRFVIAAVAHDLRTPLFALRGYLDGLEQGIAQSPEKVAKYVAVCKEKSAQLDRLVEDLFTFTKTEYFEKAFNKTNVDLVRVLEQAITTFKLQAESKEIPIMEEIYDRPCVISGDPHLLERAISNLLENAVRHTSRKGKIVVQCYKADGKAFFSIQDTGEGFATEDLHRIFEPLYRGDESRSRSTGGTGLGLTISQRIIRQHGGGLQAENHSDGGAWLKGWLPLLRNG
ncbi:hypothetical protein GCM10011391_37640 [Pullulanibacillus camelliae]|uniref:histidine kinase n=1 Tax=Pullulanibacillus camelliae TaxID=1707096 RepID=A0A8J2YNF2_9BACL|nr:HAMP domain-containing sensor histidine kinase [Pullulanibacillus camelliae]GGE55121.1 hypothetical protein GCM10011391_37640 [Pullulanibacillus camelliae]